MNNKDKRWHLVYEGLVILGVLALLTFITRLWPLLLLIILGIFVATLRLVFLSKSSQSESHIGQEPQKALSELDVSKTSYGVILEQITGFVVKEYPDAKWVWSQSNAWQCIQTNSDAFIQLNRAGGYRRAKVQFQNFRVESVEFLSLPTKPETPILEPAAKEEPESATPTENYDLIAFEWVDMHILELNARCNEALGRKQTELILSAEELPIQASWEKICAQLERQEVKGAECIQTGIKINLQDAGREL